MEKILVTGGAGFIGSHLCEFLVREGNGVICLDNMDDYYSPVQKEKNIRELRDREDFSFVKGDIRDKGVLSRLFEENGITSVVHLAARAGVRASLADPCLYADVNVCGTINLLEAARVFGVRRFVFASSSSVYGKVGGDGAFSEEMDADHPTSPYGATKRAGELICFTHHQLYGLPIAALRLFTVYGPRQRPEMAIHKFTRLIDEGLEVPIYGDGSSLRDYTFVEDIVRGIVAALNDDRGFEIYNLGNSKPVKLLEMVRLVENFLGKEARIRWLPEQPGDVPRTFADIRKAESHLGFTPRVDIESGIRRLVDWYLAAGREQVPCMGSMEEGQC